MLDVGWPELLVIAVVLIVVVGPKDLPDMLRQFGRTTAKLRAMAGDFRKQFDEALKEADMEDVRDLANQARDLNPRNAVRKHLSSFEQAGQDIKSGLDAAMKPKTDKSTEPASPAVHEAEPLKTNALQEDAPPAGANGAASDSAHKRAAKAPRKPASKAGTAASARASKAAKSPASAKAKAQNGSAGAVGNGAAAKPRAATAKNPAQKTKSPKARTRNAAAGGKAKSGSAS